MRLRALLLVLACSACSPPPMEPASSPPAPGEVPGDSPSEHAFPESLLLELQRKLGELPRGWDQKMVPEERERLERLLQSKRGTDLDQEFLLRRVLGEVIPRLGKAAPPPRSPESADKAASTPTEYVDLVTLKDGRTIRGKVVEDTPDFVKIRNKFGAVRFSREDVLKIEYGGGRSP